MDKQAFINAKAAVKDVPIPEWNDTVYVKKFSAAERVKFLQSIHGEEEESGAEKYIGQMVRILQLCLADENGIRIFDDSQEDYDIINAKDNDILSKILDEAIAFNGIGASEEKEAIKN
jgi:hypothetical protein